jgi:hypothetical protein
MHRRALLTGVSALAAARALAQPVSGPVGYRQLPPGPTNAANAGGGGGLPATAPSLDLGFLTPGVLDPRLVFTRASSGTYFDSGGVMRTAGLNIATASQTFTTGWLLGGITVNNNVGVAPDGTNTLTKFAELAGTVFHGNRYIFTSIASTVYTISAYLKFADRQYFSLGFDEGSNNGTAATFDLQNGVITAAGSAGTGTYLNSSMTAVGNGFYRCAVSGTIGAATNMRAFTNISDRSTLAFFPVYAGVVGLGTYIWGAQLELGPVATQYAPTTTVANSGPRWDYDPVSLQLRGLLLEDQRTNANPRASDYTAYTQAGVVITPGGAVAPDGSAMSTVTENTLNQGHCFYNGNSFSTTAAVWTHSVFIKPGTQRYISLRGNAVDGVPNLPWITFDTQTHTINANAYVTSSGFASLPNGVFRIWLTVPQLATACNVVVAGSNVATAPGPTISTGNPYIGTSQTWYAWGWQSEIGDFPTSYIPTTGAAVSRSIDSCLIPPANMSPWFAPPGGSWFTEFDYFNANPGGGIRVIGRSGAPGSVSPALIANTPGVANQFDAALAVPTVNTTLANTITKIATSWAAASARVCMNGGAITTSALLATGYGALATSGTSIMQIVALSATNASGHIRRVQYYPRVLADAEMQSLTTITDPSLFLNFMNPNTLDPRIAFTRASTATYTDVNGVTQTANNDTPRWDYDPVTHVLRGLLLEEARTNLIPQSTFLASWSNGAGSITFTNGIAGAPDGTATVTRFAETTTSQPHYTSILSLVLASTTYTLCVYAKAVENRYLQLGLDDGSNNGGYATFDLQTGVVSGALTGRGTAVIGTATIQPVGNGFYRCAIATTIGAFTNSRVVLCLSSVPAPTFAPNYSGNAANGLLIWGCQLEQGAFPTSFILTAGSTVTRAADSATMPTNVSWLSATAGTLLVDASSREAVASAAREYVALGTDANTTTRLFTQVGTGVVSAQSFNASVLSGAVNDTLPLVANQQFKVALSYSSAPLSLAVSRSGMVPSKVVLTAAPSGLATLFIGGGSRSIGASAAYRGVQYWPRVLADAEMQQVTT